MFEFPAFDNFSDNIYKIFIVRIFLDKNQFQTIKSIRTLYDIPLVIS